jgi:hypothetical protein
VDDELCASQKHELRFGRKQYSILVRYGGSSELRRAQNKSLESEKYRTAFAMNLHLKPPAR